MVLIRLFRLMISWRSSLSFCFVDSDIVWMSYYTIRKGRGTGTYEYAVMSVRLLIHSDIHGRLGENRVPV